MKEARAPAARPACVRLRGARVRARTTAGATGAREVSAELASERAGVAGRRLGGGRAPHSLSRGSQPPRFVGQGSEAPGAARSSVDRSAASCHALGSGLRGWSRLALEAPDKGPESLGPFGGAAGALSGPDHRRRTDPSCPASGRCKPAGWPGCHRGQGEAEHTLRTPVDLQQAPREERTFQAGKGLWSPG